MEDKYRNKEQGQQIENSKKYGNINSIISIITLNISGLNTPSKRQIVRWIKKHDSTICCLQDTHFIDFFNLLMFIFEREKQRECGRGRDRERGRHRAGSRLQAVSTEPGVGLTPMDQKIMT